MYKNFFKTTLTAFILVFLCSACNESPNPVKVFILAGQSNMSGHGEMESGDKGNLSWLMKNTDNPRFKKLMGPDGKWTERNDVFIYTANNKVSFSIKGEDNFTFGPLSAGYGAYKHTVGPELMFWNVLGDYYDEDILIIKTAWGSKSLGYNFLSPSAINKSGYVPESPKDKGFYYKKMMDIVSKVLGNIGEYVPGYKGQGYQIVGFGWHQGWHDRGNEEFVAQYTENLKYLINDIRKDLNEPELPFVIATTSMDLSTEYPLSLKLVEAQKAIMNFPEFKDNVGIVDTKGFFKKPEDSPSKKQNYHWYRNAGSYCEIGEAMGEMMWKLTKDSNKKAKIRK